MAHILKAISTIAILSQTSFLFAQTEFEDPIPADLVKIFMTDLLSGDVYLYSDIPEGFPVFTIPDNYEVLGGFKNEYQSMVILRTELDQSLAAEAIIDSLISNGWLEIGAPQMGPLQGLGFVGAEIINFPTRLCHDDFGNMSVPIEIYNGEVVVKAALNVNLGGVVLTCSEQLEMSTNPMTMRQRSGAIEYLPRLETPENSNNRGRLPFMAGSASGRNGEAQADITIRVNWSIDQIYSHLSTQLIDQDWILDTQSTGEFTNASGWTKAVADDVDLTGFLNISKMDNSEYHLSFSLRTR